MVVVVVKTQSCWEIRSTGSCTSARGSVGGGRETIGRGAGKQTKCRALHQVSVRPTGRDEGGGRDEGQVEVVVRAEQ